MKLSANQHWQECQEMSLESEWMRWQASGYFGEGYGATAGDTFHKGLRDFFSSIPCPNGRPMDTRKPADCPVHVARVEKAKQWIQEHAREFRTRDAAERITRDEILNDIEEIRQWAKSLQRHLSPIGLHESTARETS